MGTRFDQSKSFSCEDAVCSDGHIIKLNPPDCARIHCAYSECCNCPTVVHRSGWPPIKKMYVLFLYRFATWSVCACLAIIVLLNTKASIDFFCSGHRWNVKGDQK